MTEVWNMIHGYFLGEQFYWALLGSIFAITILGYLGAPLLIWSLAILTIAIGFFGPVWLVGALAAALVVFNIKPIRAALVSSIVMKTMIKLKLLPSISATERTALDAGVVWVEGDLFSGRPDFGKIMKEPYPELTAEEKAFIDGPVEKLCSMIDEWKIWTEREIPQEVWSYIKSEKFLGMIIPKEYGGLGFSALAHSEVIHKISSRSIPVAVSVMVPNSLGPAELLIHYGTQAQKDDLLPKLADGREMPCFALTEPRAGSDAGSIQASGVLFKDGDGSFKIKLNWNKRYITLAAISTTLGLAFRLRDPENLLGKGEDVGITCALIPSNTPGVVLGRRHDPMGCPFYNCPTQGNDVVISVDRIIGGVDNAGHGWQMLMDSLAAGRGVSLPGQSAGGVKTTARLVGAYTTIRKQFGLPIGKFEGIEEPMARIGGIAYTLEAMRKYTVGALDKGIKPPVVTAIAKYNATELGRIVSNDAMDIVGGAGISRGPRNLLINYYLTNPIGVTVEGANILTRTLMVFGQGALRAHPFAYSEVKAVEAGDLGAFDRAFWGHVGHVVHNAFRTVVLSLTRGYLAGSPVGGPTRRYFQLLSWTSASFALLSEVAMASLGGKLKVKEKITGRYADILSWMYICSAVLRRYQAEGCRREDLPLVHYSMQMGLREIQNAFDGILSNLEVPGATWIIRLFFRNWSRLNAIDNGIDDRLSQKVARLMQQPGEVRDRLTAGIFCPEDRQDPLGRLEYAFELIKSAEDADRKIKKAIRSKKLPKKRVYELLEEAKSQGIITEEEYQNLAQAEEIRWDAIQVDDFSEEEYKGSARRVGSSGSTHTTSGSTGSARSAVAVVKK